MTERKKRNIIIGSLCGVLLLMVVGYAAFSSVLKINGTSTISSNWDIKITNIQSETLSGSATNAKDPEGIGTLEATFETNLVSPGDSMKYTITIENQGNINAKLDKITLSEPDNEYVTFETSGLTEGDSLNAGSTADLIVTVTFKNVEINKMDKSTSNLTLTLDFSQANVDDNGIAVPIIPTITVKGVEISVVEKGDGLYLDTYESGTATLSEDTNINSRYVYKGANPDNYITFNNELWRIIAIETDGTLKIMKKASVGTRAWDTFTSSGSNDWARPATLNTYLNNDYYNNTLKNDSKLLIQNHTWGIGAVTGSNRNLAAQIASENGTTWTDNIGLISVSDIIRANSNAEQCGNLALHSNNKDTCKTTNYIVPSSGGIWSISRLAAGAIAVYKIYSDGSLASTTASSNSDIHPTLYLKSDITLSGSGTLDDPYTIN